MITTEVIKGKAVRISWTFSYIADELNTPTLKLWVVKGVGSDLKNYVGACEAHGNRPENLHDNVTDVEEVIKSQL